MAVYPQWLPGQEPDIAGAAIEFLEASVPEANFKVASPEVALIGSWAYILGEVLARYQDAPAATARHLMGWLGVEPTLGAPAFGKARFSFTTGASTVKVPAGTVLRHSSGDGEPLEFVTTQELVRITSESTVGEVEIRATTNGTGHNGLPEGTPLSTDGTYLSRVDRMEISEETRAGEDPETLESFDRRARAVLARLKSTLVHTADIREALASRPGVGRAVVLDKYNPATGATGAVGHVTVAVTDVAGLPLPTDTRDGLQQWVASQMLASLLVHVIDHTYTDVDLEVSVTAGAGWDHFDVENGVRAALENFMDPLGWPGWEQITANDLVGAIDDVPGVARVTAVPGPINLAGAAPLPRLGTVKVNVTGGGL